jgi:hypothetical protein
MNSLLPMEKELGSQQVASHLRQLLGTDFDQDT